MTIRKSYLAVPIGNKELARQVSYKWVANEGEGWVFNWAIKIQHLIPTQALSIRILYSNLIVIPALAYFSVSALTGDSDRLCKLYSNTGRLCSPQFECAIL